MRTSSMLTRQISLRARRLWRAQTNPYAPQNPARARMTDPHLHAALNDRLVCPAQGRRAMICVCPARETARRLATLKG